VKTRLRAAYANRYDRVRDGDASPADGPAAATTRHNRRNHTTNSLPILTNSADR